MTPGQLSIENANLLGAIAAHFIYVACILVFWARLAQHPRIEHSLGLVLMTALLPLVYLLASAKSHVRPPLYYVQLSLMITFLVIELLLDYVLKLDFRNVRWIVIAYVMLFFAGTGGMLGVAAPAGAAWRYSAIVFFLTMAVLAFVQRARTGM